MQTSKVFRIFFLFFLFLFVKITVGFGQEDEKNHIVNTDNIKIISRQEWGADENYRYLDSKEWKELLYKWSKIPKRHLSGYFEKKAKIEAGKVKKANNFLIKNYKEIIGVDKIKKVEKGHKLAWPLAYSKKKVSVVIHHTDSNILPGDDNYAEIKKIYKYHALIRGWGDIGYNYLIGTNGEIFEGRAGGDYVIGAHDKWNNQASIGISLIGNYSTKEAPKKQLESLKKLVKFLIKKYNINVNKKQAFFSWCVGTSQECINKPLIIKYNYPIIGHRDAGHTACPGDKLYHQLQNLKTELGVGSNDKNHIKLFLIKQGLTKLKESELLKILIKIELLLDKIQENYKSLAKREILVELKDYIFDIIESKNTIINKNDLNNKSFDLNNKIKVKLSYPISDQISFKIPKNSDFVFSDGHNEKKLDINFGKLKSLILTFLLKDNKLYLGKREIIDFQKIKFFRIRNNKDNIIEISSWNRKPSWDKTGKLNDNKFRGDIILYLKNKQLVVVNEVLLDDYLKGLGEVSDSTNTEKIKTIIILARTYARWYITKARKFLNEFYDASDNPNIFQKYLGFGLEQRSQKINKIVEETRDLVITYDGELIKPWYFSSSNGKTVSFIDYCKNAQGVPDCAHPEKFPFLVGVLDIAGLGKEQRGHGVGVPGTGVEYLSKRGWSFDMIIKYFLKGVEVGNQPK